MRKIVLLLISSLVVLCVGCAMVSKKGRPTTVPGLLEPQAISKFADIPVPVGFKLLSADSYVFESAGVRVGVLKYQGKSDPDRVINFYKEQMPLYNWNVLNIVEYGQRLMNFDRDTETCIISLLPRGRALDITISVGPKPQVPKKSTQPVK